MSQSTKPATKEPSLQSSGIQIFLVLDKTSKHFLARSDLGFPQGADGAVVFADSIENVDIVSSSYKETDTSYSPMTFDQAEEYAMDNNLPGYCVVFGQEGESKKLADLFVRNDNPISN